MSERPSRTGARALIGGGSVLAIAMLAANGGNYLLNLLLGRWLTPAEFADANLMVTLMLLVTAVAVALQLVSARHAGVHQALGTDLRADALAGWLRRLAIRAGVVLALVIGVPAAQWSTIFRTESAWPFVILAAGMPAYLLAAVGRGMLQGRLRFGPLALTFLVEMLVRVGVALALVASGFGVAGATLGLTLSFLATWGVTAILYRPSAAAAPSRAEIGDLRSYLAPVLTLLVGQIIINNGDVLVVKGFFDPTEAGVYAAIALIGRAVFFLSWSAVTTLFPAAAQREASGEASGGLLFAGIGVVGGACAAMTLAAAIGGERFFTGVFGDEYANVNGLLVRYAIATSMFAVANLIATHHLSTGRSREALLVVGGAVLQTVLLLLMRSSMSSVITAQLIAMGVLLAASAASAVLPTTGTQHRDPAPNLPSPSTRKEMVTQ